MKGKISVWKEDKGFGFISTNEQSEKIFFHISVVKKAVRKPEIGDEVVFEIGKDSQGRLRATHVLLESVLLAEHGTSKSIVTEPLRRDALDYLMYFGLALMLAVSLISFVKNQRLESVTISGSIFGVILFFLLSRKKQPRNKVFSCSKCSSISSHDERTIQAWNRGYSRLYCKVCQQKWLSERPKDYAETRTYSSSKSGCLGVLLLIVFAPVFCTIGVIKWLV